MLNDRSARSWPAAMFAAPAVRFAQDAKKCRLQKVVEWKVRSIGRHMAVDGAINGQKIGIVLDTGASREHSLPRGSQASRSPDSRRRRGQRVYGVGGEIQGR